MRVYLNVSLSELPGLRCRDIAADVLAFAEKAGSAECAADLARALDALARAADAGADAWPFVVQCNRAACGIFWPHADRVRLIEQPLDEVRRLLGLPAAGTLGVLAPSR